MSKYVIVPWNNSFFVLSGVTNFMGMVRFDVETEAETQADAEEWIEMHNLFEEQQHD